MHTILKLGVNLDHVATLRQARYAQMPKEILAEPDLLASAEACLAAGSHSITLHLRQDRRHIQDADVFAIRSWGKLPLNLEMGNDPEILEQVLRCAPDYVCLVPEKRQEITTEGGLNVSGDLRGLGQTIARLQAQQIKVSCFIDPEEDQIRASADLGVEMVELHTGAFANGDPEGDWQELERLRQGAELAQELGLQVNAGHGIRLQNLPRLLTLPHLAELNVGHHLVSQAVHVGLQAAVEQMLAMMKSYRSA